MGGPSLDRVFFVETRESPLGRLRSAGMNVEIEAVADLYFDCFSIVYVIDGSGRFQDSRGHGAPVEPGSLLLFFPGGAYSFGAPRGQTWDELYVSFGGPVFDLWQRVGVLDEQRPVRKLEPVRYWFEELRGFVARPRPVTNRDLALEICQFLSLLTSMLEHETGPTWLERADALLRSRLDHPLDMREVAAGLDMSYEAFRKRLKAETGLPPKTYRDARRVDAARELLASTTLTHRQIARSLGYANEFHFSTRFKQATGTAPSDYRRTSSDSRKPETTS